MLIYLPIFVFLYTIYFLEGIREVRGGKEGACLMTTLA